MKNILLKKSKILSYQFEFDLKYNGLRQAVLVLVRVVLKHKKYKTWREITEAYFDKYGKDYWV